MSTLEEHKVSKKGDLYRLSGNTILLVTKEDDVLADTIHYICLKTNNSNWCAGERGSCSDSTLPVIAVYLGRSLNK